MSRSELRELLELARRSGWRVEMGGSGHYKWWAPDGTTMIVTASTPSDFRAAHNIRSRLRRAGLDC